MTSRSMARLAAAVVACVGAGAGPSGCGTAPKGEGPSEAPRVPLAEGPKYGAVEKVFNERAARLQRVWALAVTSFRWTDAEGKSRWEQGEGHFQFVGPLSSAISVGKVGEVILWLGSDSTRYWMFDRTDAKRAFVGRHERFSAETGRRVGMPATPRQILTLTGMTPMWAASRLERVRWPLTTWVSQTVRLNGGATVIAQEPAAEGAVKGAWRRYIDPATGEAARVELVDTAGRTVLYSELSEYTAIRLTGTGALVRVPARMQIFHPETGASMSIALDPPSIEDAAGSRRKLQPSVFDFEQLVERLGPFTRVIDIDAAPAPSPPPSAAPVAPEKPAPSPAVKVGDPVSAGPARPAGGAGPGPAPWSERR
ncbi:MAG: hypothetical protein IBJ11_06675 [Phycisphaerales bacterium]|nr:hypothetical protein [Phycisphaerales bacterium]